jgi:hypothetical protein
MVDLRHGKKVVCIGCPCCTGLWVIFEPHLVDITGIFRSLILTGEMENAAYFSYPSVIVSAAAAKKYAVDFNSADVKSLL